MKRYIAITATLLYSAVSFANTPGISRIFEYRPAPGQFINALPEIPADADSPRVCEIVLEQIGNDAEGMISLGGFGGYVVFGFDHPVINLPGQYDFKILGNAFINDTATDGSAEPGIVMVSADINGNGIPDDPWYELAGSAFSQSRKDFRITYAKPANDNDDTHFTTNDPQMPEGAITRNTFHKQPYWPAWIDDAEMTFEGTRLPDNGVNRGENGAQYWVLSPFDWGYADNQPNSKCPGFNIDWAVDADGKPVTLDKIDFIKVYTAECQICGAIGETSTEICGAIDLHPDATNAIDAIPATDALRVERLSGQRLSLTVAAYSPFTIFSIDGQALLGGSLHPGENILELNSLPRGIAIIRTRTETKKIVL